MNDSNTMITRLFSIRTRFGKQFASEKIQLLNTINITTLKSKKAIQSVSAVLLFLITHPDNKTIYKLANNLLKQLQDHIYTNEKIKTSLYNTGITKTSVCAAFSFEMVKWIRKTRPMEIKFSSFEAGDAQIQSILSVVLPKVESEILQDENAEWKGWFRHLKKADEDLLDQLIDLFDSSDIRPEVKDELWNAIGINVEINFTSQCCLPQTLVEPYYHRSLIRKVIPQQAVQKPIRVKLSESEAEQLIDCSRMILLRNLREIDPTSFTAAEHASYYQLGRGISVALMGMMPERRHPVDSYLSYTIFKNGLPVGYGGCWILFNSGRIGFNIFPDYRGGESKYIFDQVLQLHRKLYGLKRFTADPYQVGKENSEGIQSGAFWIYYRAGFRPLQKQQQLLATAEDLKINADKNYRSPAPVLKTLANSRLQLVLQKSAVRFDATDLSLAYASILAKKFKGNRGLAERDSAKKLAIILQIKNYQEEKIKFILKNWALLLLSNEKELRINMPLKKALKKLFELKANGSEEEYITVMQRSVELRQFIEGILKEFITPGK
jgi:hypothetical protein